MRSIDLFADYSARYVWPVQNGDEESFSSRQYAFTFSQALTPLMMLRLRNSLAGSDKTFPECDALLPGMVYRLTE